MPGDLSRPLLHLLHQENLLDQRPAERPDNGLHVRLLPGQARAGDRVLPLFLPAHPGMAGGDEVEEILLVQVPPAVDFQVNDVPVARVRVHHGPGFRECDGRSVPGVREVDNPLPEPVAGDRGRRAGPAVPVRWRVTVSSVVPAEAGVHVIGTIRGQMNVLVPGLPGSSTGYQPPGGYVYPVAASTFHR